MRAMPGIARLLPMKRFLIILVCLLCLPGCQPTVAAPPPTIEVYFSPKGGCTEAVVKELGAAKSTVFVQAYSFTSAPIAKALVDAHKRGVDVRVILDKSQRSAKYSSAAILAVSKELTFTKSRVR